jgi:quercetin dioxygenase-like cupin family protein
VKPKLVPVPLEQALAESDLPAGRAELLRLEAAIAKAPQVDLPLRELFVKGLYVRELTIPKGIVVTGHIHMTECITTLAKGRILLTEGDGVREIEAPFTGCFAAGTKKAVYALEDSVYVDAYANPDDERDSDKLEAHFLAKSHQDYLTRTALLLEKS